MTVREILREYASPVVCCAVVVALAACGGSGTSSGSSKTGNGGTGGNSGATPTFSVKPASFTPTPTVTSTPTPLILVESEGSILAAVHAAPPGARINVAPGVYAPIALQASDVQGPLTIVADASGEVSGTGAHPVVIDAAKDPSAPAAAAITLSGIPADAAVVLDGFTLRNGTTAGVVVDNSPGSVVQNCILTENRGDGALFTQSDRALLLDNLIFANTGAGVRVLGTTGIAILNNTIYGNTDTGVSIGDAQDASPNAQLENNLIASNTPFGIVVASNSMAGYQEDYNLNNDGSPAGVPTGMHDLPATTSPLFAFPPRSDFHLQLGSPAIDAGDPATAAFALNVLQHRTTTDGDPDCGVPDLGYHYPSLTHQTCPALTLPSIAPPTPTP